MAVFMSGEPTYPKQSDRPNRRPTTRAWRTVAMIRDEGERGALTPARLEHLRPLDRHADRNSDAEYAFYHLPGRFQRFADECIFATERILAFVPWSATTGESWRQRVGRLFAVGGREARAGAVILTDHAILFMEDDAEVAGGSVAWGYTCLATSHERLAEVIVRETEADHCELKLVLRTEGGEEAIQRIFPQAVEGEIRALARLLTGFRPEANRGRLRLPGQILPWERLTVAPETGPRRGMRMTPTTAPSAAADTRQLAARLCAILPSDAPAAHALCRRHQATALVTESEGQRQSLLIMTREHLALLPIDGSGNPLLRPLAAVTSVSLRRSVLATRIAMTLGTDPQQPPDRIAVSFPVAGGMASLPVFAALRQGLTLLPGESREPDPAQERSFT